MYVGPIQVQAERTFRRYHTVGMILRDPLNLGAKEETNESPTTPQYLRLGKSDEQIQKN